ncbi:MAG: hypothetical protein KY476_17570 [Planctomycetes bacterium]|nr:hypothetical protein [Planctomycetota bacterium]
MILQRYSSDVELKLVVEGSEYRLAQIGPGFIMFRDTPRLPQCMAEIVMTVDGREQRWPVRLVDGAVPFDEAVRAIACVD